MLQDPLISSKFECHIFVRMGLPHEWEETVRAIAAQLDPHEMLKPGNEDLQDYLCKTFEVKKSLIVLDDVWDECIFDDLQSIILRKLGSSSWKDIWCPYELEKAGKKIAENCEGLPLLILTVASLYPTPEHWIEIAANKTNSIFVDAYEQVSEGFLGITSYKDLRRHVELSFLEMVSDNVALCIEQSANYDFYKPKACSLHSVFWYLSKTEARNEKFLQVLNSYTDASVQGIESQRRLSIYKNILFSIKDVRDSMASISVVRSLLCTDMSGFKVAQDTRCTYNSFLRVPTRCIEANSLKVPFPHLQWESPSFHIRNVEPSMLDTQSTSDHQVLRISVISTCGDMGVARVRVSTNHGKKLTRPPSCRCLKILMILLDVGAHTCTKRVVKSIPNLRKLRVHDIESWEFDAAPPPSFYDDISHLRELRSIQYLVVGIKTYIVS
ncbi:hypothetical protein ACS0TY_026201 [Phlomoides rotata]